MSFPRKISRQKIARARWAKNPQRLKSRLERGLNGISDRPRVEICSSFWKKMENTFTYKSRMNLLTYGQKINVRARSGLNKTCFPAHMELQNNDDGKILRDFLVVFANGHRSHSWAAADCLALISTRAKDQELAPRQPCFQKTHDVLHGCNKTEELSCRLSLEIIHELETL